LFVASTGANPRISGSSAWVPRLTILASDGPGSESSPISSADAPSFSDEESPAVTVPLSFANAGFSVASLSVLWPSEI